MRRMEPILGYKLGGFGSASSDSRWVPASHHPDSLTSVACRATGVKQALYSANVGNGEGKRTQDFGRSRDDRTNHEDTVQGGSKFGELAPLRGLEPRFQD